MSRKYTSIYGIHFTATFFFFFDTAVAAAVAAAVVMFLRFAWWLKAIYYDECVEIFHRLRFLMQSKCIFFWQTKRNPSRFFLFFRENPNGFCFTTNKFSFALVFFFRICCSRCHLLVFCWHFFLLLTAGIY